MLAVPMADYQAAYESGSEQVRDVRGAEFVAAIGKPCCGPASSRR
jgi:hypothetical protein